MATEMIFLDTHKPTAGKSVGKRRNMPHGKFNGSFQVEE
jgi:hypothetical protein